MAEKKTRSIFEDASTNTPTEAAPSPGAAAKEKSANRGRIRFWQIVLALLVVAMVVIGGLTRLTDSGLSITEWNLVTGVLPPLSQEAWAAEFAKYQKIPEFQEVNSAMTLAEFKPIYWWEWGHRFLGRIVGLVFIVPFLWFFTRKTIPAGWTKRLLIPGILIGIQGVLGWWMVTSGLTERIDVAPYRLATHLGLAFIIFALLVWNIFCLGHEEHELLAARRRRFKPLLGLGGVATALIFLQILVGAMVAGLDAGTMYNDWPLMGGAFLPDSSAEGVWQFIHRMLGYLILCVVLMFWLNGRALGHAQVRFWTTVAFMWVMAQVVWGIVTLMGGADWFHSIVHQSGALLLMFVMMRAKFEIAYPTEQKIART
ncbi:UNVERIFIED_CONTAM: hypothetical protein GTU68_041842 [Idotea baltica]|nr:hypothetical protein [Idotea baltica]